MKPFIALAFTSALTLQGCAFAPGQYLDPDEFKEGAEAEHGTVQLVRITPEMLRELASTRAPRAAGTARLRRAPTASVPTTRSTSPSGITLN